MANMTPQEQLMLELINRARMDPNGEAARYGIALNEGLAAGTISSAPKQVLAGSDTLDAAADAHSQWMLTHNIFAHDETGGGTGTTPDARMIAAGYGPINWWGENIAASGTSETITDAVATQLIEQEHQMLFVDTDVDDRGHRLNILSDNFKEVGIGQQIGSFTFDTGTYNTSMVTQDFGKSGTGLFITGVVYNDTVINDDFFSVGEQVANLGVSSAEATDQTGAGGGYELLYGAGGAKSVAFNLASGTITVDLTLGATNAKVDVVNGSEVWSNTSITSVSSNVAELHALGIGNVELDAAGGNQRLYGNSGNNILNGGDGTDTAVFDGNFANFSITKNVDGSYQVQDLVGSQGTDTISNIESLQFSDRLYTFANSAPTLNGAIADQQVTSGSAFSLDVPANLFTDPDGDTLSYTAQAAGGGALPGWLTFDANTMTFSGTPAKADAGTVAISLIASDGAHSTVDTFDLVVKAANEAPEAIDDSATMQEHQVALVDVMQNDSDPDGDAISISRLVSHSDNASVSIVNGKIQVEYTGPDIAFGTTGQVDVVYEITDSHGKTDSATLAVTVTDSDGPPNSAPVANDDLVNLDAGVKTALVDVAANDSDPDNDAFSVTRIVSVSGNAQAVIENGQVRVNYTGADLAPGATGEMDVVYEITDSHGKTDTATLAVTLKGSDIVPNSPPVANDDPVNLDAGVKTALVDVAANDSDPDNDAFNVTRIVSVSGNAQAVIENGRVRVNYTGADLAPGATGEMDVVYEITDAHGKTDTATLAVTLKGSDIVPNSPPVANDDLVNLDAGVKTALVDVAANDSDPDNDAFSVTRIVSVSGNAQAVIENGRVRVNYTGAALGAGATDTVDLVYEITDKNGATDTATLTVNLKGADESGQDIIGSNKGEKLQGTGLGEYIAGLKGADDLYGKGGNDILNGGRGSDDLYGGTGADVFIFNSKSGHDNIYDFSHAEGDKIDLSGVKGISSYQDLVRHHVSFDQFEGVLISVNHGNDLWVEDMDGRHMHKSDFIF